MGRSVASGTGYKLSSAELRVHRGPLEQAGLKLGEQAVTCLGNSHPLFW